VIRGRGPILIVREHEDGGALRWEAFGTLPGASQTIAGATGVCQVHELRAVVERLISRESGDSIPAGVCPECRKTPCIGHPGRPDAPVLNKSGGSDVEKP
jgi:hypothetical protein